MEWSPPVRRLLLGRVQVLRNEVLDALHMSGAGRPVQRRTSMRIHGGAEAVLVSLQEGQVAGRRGVEHVGVLRCGLLTDHFKAAFCVWESSGWLRAERVELVRSAFFYDTCRSKYATFNCSGGAMRSTQPIAV